MKTAIELADAADAVASWLELRFYTKSSNDVKSCAERLRELSKENEALLKANLDCVDNFNTLKADYDALKADAQRLDWLETTRMAYGTGDCHEGNSWLVEGSFVNVRVAIDAIAMKGKS